MIKRFLLILVLIFNLQSWTKADDISDFEIEGMSIGDSLLDYYSEEEIKIKKNDRDTFYYKDNKFVDIFFQLNNKTYEWLQISIKPNDKKYLIHAVSGQIDYIGNIDKCYKDMDNIFLNIKKNFNPKKFIQNQKVKHDYDKSGNSLATYSKMKFDNGVINIECYDWSDQLPFTDKLMVSVMSTELRNFIDNEAYN